MKLYLVAGMAVAIVVGLSLSHAAAYRAGKLAGQTSVADHINQENDNAGNTAEKWRGDLRRCLDAGGVFDFEIGACDK